ESSKSREESNRGRKDVQIVNQVMRIVHRFARRDHSRRDVGKQGETGCAGGDLLVRRVEKNGVAAAIEWQGAPHFGVNATKEIEHTCDNQQHKWSKDSCMSRAKR